MPASIRWVDLSIEQTYLKQNYKLTRAFNANLHCIQDILLIFVSLHFLWCRRKTGNVVLKQEIPLWFYAMRLLAVHLQYYFKKLYFCILYVCILYLLYLCFVFIFRVMRSFRFVSLYYIFVAKRGLEQYLNLT